LRNPSITRQRDGFREELNPSYILCLMNKSTMRERAFAIIKERSFARGKFVLASGRESSVYLDLKPTMFHPEGANLVARLLLDKLKDRPVDYVGGLEMGAVPLVTAVTLMSAETARPIPGFFVRKNVKKHGTERRIEAVRDLKGRNVVILEDVTTTGGSSMQAVLAAQEAGAQVILVLTVVDRREGAAEFFQEQGLPFEWLFRAEEFLAS
jgi:orotate phosphoribosyltransferase